MASDFSRRGLLGTILGALAGRLFGAAPSPAAKAAPAVPAAPVIPRYDAPWAADSAVTLTYSTYVGGRLAPSSAQYRRLAGFGIPTEEVGGVAPAGDPDTVPAAGPAAEPRKRDLRSGPVGA